MGLPNSRVDEMLATVSLNDSEAGRRLRDYSLGMKQRLGIAHALLGDPEVLILDEPANGLDPAGIRWMRDLLRDYAASGGTVLLSSHLLNEVELIADEMIVIGRGRIVARGDKESLLSAASGGSQESAVVSALDRSALADALRQEGIANFPDGTGLRVAASTAEVSRVALQHLVVLTELRNGSAGLEDLFLELTSDTQREGAHASSTNKTGTAA
jgi:ABC-2 type transport system ATP-binding protein